MKKGPLFPPIHFDRRSILAICIRKRQLKFILPDPQNLRRSNFTKHKYKAVKFNMKKMSLRILSDPLNLRRSILTKPKYKRQLDSI